MELRFTLSHEIEGSIIVSDPEGWDGAVSGFSRDENLYSLVEYYKSAFSAYGSNGVENGGRDWLKNIEKVYGLDAIIYELVEEKEEGGEFEVLFEIEVSVKEFIEAIDFGHNLDFTFTQKSFWRKFISRIDTPVNIQSETTLDGDAVTPLEAVDVTLTTQIINKKYQGYVKNNHQFFPSANQYGGLDFDVEVISEIEDTFAWGLLNEFSTVLESVVFPKFTLLYGGNHIIESLVTISDYSAASITSPPQTGISLLSTIGKIKVYIQVNGNIPIEFTATDRVLTDEYIVLNNGSTVFISGPTTDGGVSSVVTEYRFNETLTLDGNDTIRVYIKRVGVLNNGIRIFGVDGDNKAAYGIAEGIDGKIGDFAGYYDASLGLFPSSLPAGDSFWLGNVWEVSYPGTIAGVDVQKGWLLRAIAETPGQDPDKWDISDKGFTEGLFKFGESYLNVLAETTFPQTTCKAFFQHDVFGAILDRITNIPGVFTSRYLGGLNTKYKAYGSDGKIVNYMNARGLQIRQYTLEEKPFAQSFKEQWLGVDPIFPLSARYDKINGEDRIIIGKREECYINTPSIALTNVKTIKRYYDQSCIYNAAEVGYRKDKDNNIFGIDDSQLKRTFANILKTAGKKVQMFSNFIAASITWETTRRTTKEKSKDYQYDDETFILAVKKVDGVYKPALDENFSIITNLLNKETRYNTILSATHNFLRNLVVLNGCLQSYLTSTWKFVSGEGNYDMTSTMADNGEPESFGGANLSEKQDIPVSENYIHLPLLYEIDHFLTREMYKAIQANRHNAIAVSQTESDFTNFFIKELTYERSTGKVKIIAWPKTFMDLRVVNNDYEGASIGYVFDNTFSHPPFG